MALAPTQQSSMDGGSRSWDERNKGSFMGNLGKFFMYAGTGAAQGIGQGLANVDPRRPWQGAGMGILGGVSMGADIAKSRMRMDTAQAALPEEVERERAKMSLRLEEYQNKLDADLEQEKKLLGSFKPMRRGSAEEQEMMKDRGELKIGTSYLSPAGKVFVAQQGMAAAEAARILSGVRSGVGRMA